MAPAPAPAAPRTRSTTRRSQRRPADRVAQRVAVGMAMAAGAPLEEEKQEEDGGGRRGAGSMAHLVAIEYAVLADCARPDEALAGRRVPLHHIRVLQNPINLDKPHRCMWEPQQATSQNRPTPTSIQSSARAASSIASIFRLSSCKPARVASSQMLALERVQRQVRHPGSQSSTRVVPARWC